MSTEALTRPLNRNQQKIIDAIRMFWSEHWYSPSIRDLQKMTGISSTSVISYHLLRLEGKGLLKLPPLGSGITRAIVPIGDSCPCCGREA